MKDEKTIQTNVIAVVSEEDQQKMEAANKKLIATLHKLYGDMFQAQEMFNGGTDMTPEQVKKRDTAVRAASRALRNGVPAACDEHYRTWEETQTFVPKGMVPGSFKVRELKSAHKGPEVA